MSPFSPWIQPLHQSWQEASANGWTLAYEGIPTHIDSLGPLLYNLVQEHWADVQLGHVVEGGVLELSFKAPPALCVLYDGYLTVATETWHLHLCLEEHQGGPHNKTPPELRKKRLVSRAALYQRLNPDGKPRMWGIQFWNGAGESLMQIFLPSPFLGSDEDYLPEGKADYQKLSLYEEIRQIYVEGKKRIPYDDNPLKRPYLSVCRSSRCNPSRCYQPIVTALESAVQAAQLNVKVITSGCLEVCQRGPVVFYSGDRTWYTRVTPEIAKRIVQEHVIDQCPLKAHLFPGN
ncbi:(2Fe-2S) ferredoxin domain-containing protein [Thermostichus vulcanus]|uniref:(2Fe-2S) ferredoxin domain-containing protein n=1 Tax=Thermostichus vulcanus str. 'Rupite' TaxID=2813851 RepID=A0ABT0CB63_THEVL|nr:(2Fe-2S) ferredoxin domain-containing protein [Thermostichus vulcanus]MCJ2543031.1 (2Fe-2S) ferredoxin domain-containing protein [Thermostichus vulcanus str. 'Rupite']